MLADAVAALLGDHDRLAAFAWRSRAFALDHCFEREFDKRIGALKPLVVELGIRVAQGEALPLKQEDITWRGHSIQCRLNAEDPREFVPSPGRLWECHFPSGFGIRCDTHAHPGYEMPGCFDSLLAKLLVWGRDREDAIRRMKTALDETMITGVEHLIPLHRRIMDEEDFNNGDITIQYIDMHQELLG